MNLLLFAVAYVLIGLAIAWRENKLYQAPKDWCVFVVILWPVLVSGWIVWSIIGDFEQEFLIQSIK